MSIFQHAFSCFFGTKWHRVEKSMPKNFIFQLISIIFICLYTHLTICYRFHKLVYITCMVIILKNYYNSVNIAQNILKCYTNFHFHMLFTFEFIKFFVKLFVSELFKKRVNWGSNTHFLKNNKIWVFKKALCERFLFLCC